MEQIRCYNGSEYDTGFSIVKDNITCFEETISNFIETPVNGSYTSNTIIHRQEIQDYITLLVATLATFFAIMVFTCLIMYRQEMRVWFHSKFGDRLFYRTTDIELDDRDKLFDAFVSYSEGRSVRSARSCADVRERRPGVQALPSLQALYNI